jgi:hypothetical protein
MFVFAALSHWQLPTPSAQGATGVATPFGQGLNLRKIEPVAAWIEPYAGLYQDYRARLDATKAQFSL